MAQVFFSYSHDDEVFRDRLEKHLSMLKNQGLIEAWHDRRIEAGSSVDDSINAQLDAADVVLLLVSASFLASTYCYSREMTRALERHNRGEAVVIPVIVHPCDWHPALFGHLLAAPKDGKAITTWPNTEEAFADVARQVRVVVERLSASGARSSVKTQPAAFTTPASATSESVAANAALPRSSNLRLKKEFSELDLDRFLREGFEYISKFFEGSLQELEARNEGINTNFHRVDGNTFTAAIYRAGKKVAECSVHTGSGGFGRNTIVFSFDVASRGQHMNESLSAGADDQSMFLTSMGMSFHQQRGQHLSHEGGAELFWQMLIGRLQ
jgi:hypothetical protein